MQWSRSVIRARSARLAVESLLIVFTAGTACAAGWAPTTCIHLCEDLTPTLCTVDSTVHVVPGSIIDCGARAVEVRGGHVLVHDGAFELRAASVLVTNGGSIKADCPQGFQPIGFAVRTPGAVALTGAGNPRLTARCAAGGGVVVLEAGGPVTVAGGVGIDASGTMAGAPGGRIDIRTPDAVTVSSPLRADASGGVAAGGQVEIHGGSIAVSRDVSVWGYGEGTLAEPGGQIVLDAEGALSITGTAVLAANSGQGEGGGIELEAGGTLRSQGQLRARGTGGGSGLGGSIALAGARVEVDNDVLATGGRHGGTIAVEARGGGIVFGTAGQTLAVDASGDNGGDGGKVTVTATGSDVTVGGGTTVRANTSGGPGGAIALLGVGVTAQSGSRLLANGASGGDIVVEARGPLTLTPRSLQATTGGRLEFVYRQGTPVIGSGVAIPYTLTQEATLSAACGDGVRKVGTEACDEPDLAGQTCASLGLGTGTMRCAATCTFDASGCTP